MKLKKSDKKVIDCLVMYHIHCYYHNGVDVSKFGEIRKKIKKWYKRQNYICK